MLPRPSGTRARDQFQPQPSDNSWREVTLENRWRQAVTSVLHRYNQPIHDVILPFRRVLAHVKGENAGSFGLRRVFHFAQTHFLTDELREFFWTDFAQAFEP